MPPLGKLTHSFAVLGYAAAAAGGAAVLIGTVPGVDPTAAAALALAAFATCGLAHQALTRARRTADLAADLRALRRGHAELREEVGNARRELGALLEALEAAGGTRGIRGEPAAVARITGEVRVLKRLVERLFEDSEAAAPEAVYLDAARHPEPAAAAAVAEPVPATAGAAPPRALPDVRHEIDAAAALETVREALRHDRVDVVLQPVVGLPQRKRRYVECFSRVRSADGYTILPEQYIDVAERAGLVAAIDNLLLFRCVQLVRKLQRRHSDTQGSFLNVSLASLHDHGFVEELTAFLQQNRELAAGLIFEVAQAAAREAQPEELRYLARLGRLGCRFSIDRVDDLGEIDPEALQRLRVRFVKADARLLLETAQRDGLDRVRRLKRSLETHGIDLIADRVEDEDTLVELLDLGIDFGQGFLFGEPRLARP